MYIAEILLDMISVAHHKYNNITVRCVCTYTSNSKLDRIIHLMETNGTQNVIVWFKTAIDIIQKCLSSYIIYVWRRRERNNFISNSLPIQFRIENSFSFWVELHSKSIYFGYRNEKKNQMCAFLYSIALLLLYENEEWIFSLVKQKTKKKNHSGIEHASIIMTLDNFVFFQIWIPKFLLFFVFLLT